MNELRLCSFSHFPRDSAHAPPPAAPPLLVAALLAACADRSAHVDEVEHPERCVLRLARRVAELAEQHVVLPTDERHDETCRRAHTGLREQSASGPLGQVCLRELSQKHAALVGNHDIRTRRAWAEPAHDELVVVCTAVLELEDELTGGERVREGREGVVACHDADTTGCIV